MVFQSYALYPHMSVYDNIAFPLRAVGNKTDEEIKEKVKWAASTLGIEHLLDRKPRQLSGGERQRVALSRALAKEPEVLLLDEPLSNLDAKLRASARDELQRFQRRLGITTVFVTHDQVEAMGLGDRIVVMNFGRVRQIGTPREVYHDSADTFVATFLGSPGMNFIEVGDTLVGFRPEQFVPKETVAPGKEVAELQFQVARVEYLGADQLLYGEVEYSERKFPAIAKLSSEETIPIQPGEVHEFVVGEEQLRFFNLESGLRTTPRELQ
jgi:multiple sugar transport system ATP-binding protein